MTESDWGSSYEIIQALKTLGCEINFQSNPEYVNVYNPKSEKIISMKANGKIPPYEVELIFQTLKIK